MNDPRSPTAQMWLTDSRVYNLVWLGRWIERAHAVCRSVEVAAASSDAEAIPRAAGCCGIAEESNGVSLAYFLRELGEMIHNCIVNARNDATQVGPLDLIRELNALSDDFAELWGAPANAVEALDASQRTQARMGVDQDVSSC